MARSANSSSMTAAGTSSSAKPAQLLSATISLRYSSAASPTMLALSRSGRSLVTTATSAPSLARLRATARMRWSLASDRSVAGRPASSWWLTSTRTVPPCSLTGKGRTSVP